MRTRKVCLIGDFAVGKTSLVSRFVHSTFGEQYLTTVGVKIDTKEVSLPSGDSIKLVLWDIAGKSEFAPIDTSYLRDAAGYLLVADGTRVETLHSAVELQASVERQLGRVPFGLVLNKVDLEDRWVLDRNRLAAVDLRGWRVGRTSALNGNGVETAFAQLGAQLMHET
ncbi:MAG: Rab family GTPase [Sedimenticolaceae bacterium]